ncbi:MAG: putative Fe-S cluster assembly protein SufT [Verrucomicrobiota bacterium]
MTGEKIELRRDVEAIQIPHGLTQTLEKGTSVVITQSLGGTYTVHVDAQGGLFRLASRDADALGFEVMESADSQPEKGPLEEQVWAALKTCYDPEIPVNIVDLGLVYSMDIVDSEGDKKVNVKMTLTAPGCGMGPSIAADAKSKILAIDEISETDVELVWEPQWEPAMISPAGKLKLGIED